MLKRSCTLCKIVGAIAIIGAFHWGLVGLAQVNMVQAILGIKSAARWNYALVGPSATALLVSYFLTRLALLSSVMWRQRKTTLRLKRIVTTSIFLAVLGTAVPPALAQLTRLYVGYSALGADNLPAWVAKETGICQKNGLDVGLIFFTGGSTAILGLVSGDVPITQVSGPGLVSSALAGADAVYVAGGIISLNHVLVGKPGITSPEQLKAGSVAISRFGSATDSIARFALKKIGLTPGKDVTIVQVGSVPDRLNAVLTGKVTAAVLNPPASFMAERKALVVLADVAKMGLVFQHTGPATTRKFIREHRDTVRRYVKSHVEAVARIWTDKDATVKILGKFLGGGVDRDMLERSREDNLTESLLSRKQYPTLEGLKTVLDDLAERDPRAKTAKPEQFVDLTFIQELNQSGYIDSLYKKK